VGEMNLKNYSIDDLKAELERREKKELEPPKRIQNPNLTEIITMCESHIAEIANGTYHEDNDFKTYLYEVVMATFYSGDFWPWKRDMT
jgi:hypothetical protein